MISPVHREGITHCTGVGMASRALLPPVVLTHTESPRTSTLLRVPEQKQEKKQDLQCSHAPLHKPVVKHFYVQRSCTEVIHHRSHVLLHLQPKASQSYNARHRVQKFYRKETERPSNAGTAASEHGDSRRLTGRLLPGYFYCA
jgi:hypothetical protein